MPQFNFDGANKDKLLEAAQIATGILDAVIASPSTDYRTISEVMRMMNGVWGRAKNIRYLERLESASIMASILGLDKSFANNGFLRHTAHCTAEADNDIQVVARRVKQLILESHSAQKALTAIIHELQIVPYDEHAQEEFEVIYNALHGIAPSVVITTADQVQSLLAQLGLIDEPEEVSSGDLVQQQAQSLSELLSLV